MKMIAYYIISLIVFSINRTLMSSTEIQLFLTLTRIKYYIPCGFGLCVVAISCRNAVNYIGISSNKIE